MKGSSGPERSGVVRGRSSGVKPGARLPPFAVTFEDFRARADGSCDSQSPSVPSPQYNCHSFNTCSLGCL